jgi:CHRD domain
MARRTGLVLILAIGGVLMLVLASVSAADHGKGKGKWKGNRSFEVKLTGYEEVPSISTAARGKLKLKVRNGSTGTIEYRLSYSGLTAPATQAHIHFAQKGVNGGILLWLCDSAAINSPVADTPACPAGNTANKETVSGTLDATDVQAIAGQGIAAGELLEVFAAMKAGVTYANVHTAAPPGFAGGEIRGQLGHKRGDD